MNQSSQMGAFFINTVYCLTAENRRTDNTVSSLREGTVEQMNRRTGELNGETEERFNNKYSEI